jgi:hypothetical protein
VALMALILYKAEKVTLEQWFMLNVFEMKRSLVDFFAFIPIKIFILFKAIQVPVLYSKTRTFLNINLNKA